MDGSGGATAAHGATCPACGAAVQADMAFCPKCGGGLSPTAAEPGTRSATGPKTATAGLTESLGRGLSEGDEIWDSYRLEARLGQGGMGTVFRARNIEETQEVVAIKLLDPGEAGVEAARKRLQREAFSARGLHHPSIVQVYEFRAEGEHVGLVMEHLDGATLADHLSGKVHASPFTRGELAPRLERIAAVAEQMASALDYIHGKDLVHRDVKPSNVMVIADGADGRPVETKLLDFGVVHAVHGADMTGVEQPGTVIYMAPELLRNEGVPTPAADIYSFGLVLYQLLTGKMPAGNPRPPSKAVPDLPSSLDDAVLGCLNEPQDRPASAGEVAAVVRAAHRELVEAIERQEREAAEAEERRRTEEAKARLEAKEAAERATVEREAEVQRQADARREAEARQAAEAEAARTAAEAEAARKAAEAEAARKAAAAETARRAAEAERARQAEATPYIVDDVPNKSGAERVFFLAVVGILGLVAVLGISVVGLRALFGGNDPDPAVEAAVAPQVEPPADGQAVAQEITPEPATPAPRATPTSTSRRQLPSRAYQETAADDTSDKKEEEAADEPDEDANAAADTGDANLTGTWKGTWGSDSVTLKIQSHSGSQLRGTMQTPLVSGDVSGSFSADSGAVTLSAFGETLSGKLDGGSISGSGLSLRRN